MQLTRQFSLVDHQEIGTVLQHLSRSCLLQPLLQPGDRLLPLCDPPANHGANVAQAVVDLARFLSLVKPAIERVGVGCQQFTVSWEERRVVSLLVVHTNRIGYARKDRLQFSLHACRQ